jgi:hypothetical protein
MKKVLLGACAIFIVLALAGCYSGDAGQYERDHDKYVRSIEPKTGGPDL